MDYFDLVNSNREADLAHAKWYSKLPNERKAEILFGMHEFGVESIKYNTKKENPFLSEPELLLCYIELTLKKYYTEEVFAFIKEQMAIKAEKAWKERFKVMKEELGWSYDNMAKYMGAKNGASLKASISRKLPAFAKLAICVFEEMKNKQIQED